MRWLATAIIVLSLAAAALCLGVAEVSYRFLHYVERTGPATLDYTNEINHLATLVDWRTAHYQIAWWCSIIAIPLFLAMFWVSLHLRNQGGAAHE
jgi:hypothetical protein